MLQSYYKSAYALIRPACPACFVAISPRVYEQVTCAKSMEVWLCRCACQGSMMSKSITGRWPLECIFKR